MLNPNPPKNAAFKTTETTLPAFIRLDPRRQLLPIKEIRLYLGCSEQHVRDLVESGWLMAFPINDRPTVRQTLRINRFSLEGWFLHQWQKQSAEVPFTVSSDAKWWADQLAKRPGTRN